MLERTLKGGPIKAQGIRGQQVDTPEAGSRESRAPRDPNAENGRGFVKNFARKGAATRKPQEEAMAEGWRLGPLARMGMRRLREPGLKEKGF